MAILTIDDFENGEYRIAVNPKQEAGLDARIKNVEDRILPLLFGIDLSNLFLIDFGSVTPNEPNDPRFIAVYEPFTELIDDCIITSNGMREMLKGFVYFFEVRHKHGRNTAEGIKKTNGINSTNMSSISLDVMSRYNDAVETFKAIRAKMVENDNNDYDDYEGFDIDFNHIF